MITKVHLVSLDGFHYFLYLIINIQCIFAFEIHGNNGKFTAVILFIIIFLNFEILQNNIIFFQHFCYSSYNLFIIYLLSSLDPTNSCTFSSRSCLVIDKLNFDIFREN